MYDLTVQDVNIIIAALSNFTVPVKEANVVLDVIRKLQNQAEASQKTVTEE